MKYYYANIRYEDNVSIRCIYLIMLRFINVHNKVLLVLTDKVRIIIKFYSCVEFLFSTKEATFLIFSNNN